jgi:putative peptidoglycan lipid II flippase
MAIPSEEQPAAPRPSIVGAAGSVSAATAVSRILGVVREMVMARYFGAGLYTDAFNVAFRIPNLLRDLFAEGALSAAFVPTFVRSMTQAGRSEAWLLANRVLSALLLILGAVTLLTILAAKGLVFLLAAGFSATPGKFALTTLMTRIMSPFLLFIAFASVMMGVLNACGSFFVPALSSSAFNICCILAGVFLSPFMPRWGLDPIVSMAVGALVGGVSQFLAQVPSAWRAGFRFRFVPGFSDPGLRHMATLMLPAVIGLSATQINITVDNQLASYYGDGPVSWLNYAFRLMQLPIGLFGVAIATATTTAVSYHAALDSGEEVRGTVSSSLRLAACLTFPATAGLIIFRREIVHLLYERGSFGAIDTLQTSRVLLYYALALFAYSAVKILVPVFYALHDTRTPVRTSIISVAAKVGINLVLMLRMQFLGLALATALGSWFNFVLLMRALARHSGRPWNWRGLGVYLRIALASLVMAVISRGAFEMAEDLLGSGSEWAMAANLGIAIAAGIGSILPLLHLLKVEEAGSIAAVIRGRGRKA